MSDTQASATNGALKRTESSEEGKGSAYIASGDMTSSRLGNTLLQASIYTKKRTCAWGEAISQLHEAEACSW